MARPAAAQDSKPFSVVDWLSVSANLDGGYRKTQFFQTDHHVALFQWDSRADVWLPPFRAALAWGPYVRLAGIKASRREAWENAWLGRPGVGLQVYPISAARFQYVDSLAGRLLGPLRLFAERNAVDYWGDGNQWRPRRQTRIGLDYWKALFVNDRHRAVWTEIWNGAYWQSSNEFAGDYDTTIVADAVRVGVRKPRSGTWSSFSVYGALESSKTRNESYYHENRLLLGAGVRFVPSPVFGSVDTSAWLSRVVVYGEILTAAKYYGAHPPPYIPRADVHLGVSVSIGDWYK